MTASPADGEEALVGKLLLDIGMINPVTKDNAGALYHQELARQLGEFLTLEKTFPHSTQVLVSLSDVYCMFNRARGSELISPDDCYYAAQLLQPLNLGFHLHTFVHSGLRVIRSDAYREDRMVQRLEKLIRGQRQVSSAFVALEWKISLALAQELLLTAELGGVLCRDDSVVEGLVFYSNRFAQW